MNNQNITSIQEAQKFLLPAMVDSESDFTPEEIAEDMDGLQMNFQRVKFPSGSMLQFELPSDDPENPDYAKTLEGVILYNHASCVYWPDDDESDDNTAPFCSSADGKQGIGDPGGTCATCALNRFGSAPTVMAEKRVKICVLFICFAAMSICRCKSTCLQPVSHRSVIL